MRSAAYKTCGFQHIRTIMIREIFYSKAVKPCDPSGIISINEQNSLGYHSGTKYIPTAFKVVENFKILEAASSLTGIINVGVGLYTLKQVQDLRRGVERVEEGVKRVEEGVKRVEEGVKRVEEGVKRVEEGVRLLNRKVDLISEKVSLILNYVGEIDKGLRQTAKQLKQIKADISYLDDTVRRQYALNHLYELREMYTSFLTFFDLIRDSNGNVDSTAHYFLIQRAVDLFAKAETILSAPSTHEYINDALDAQFLSVTIAGHLLGPDKVVRGMAIKYARSVRNAASAFSDASTSNLYVAATQVSTLINLNEHSYQAVLLLKGNAEAPNDRAKRSASDDKLIADLARLGLILSPPNHAEYKVLLQQIKENVRDKRKFDFGPLLETDCLDLRKWKTSIESILGRKFRNGARWFGLGELLVSEQIGIKRNQAADVLVCYNAFTGRIDGWGKVSVQDQQNEIMRILSADFLGELKRKIPRLVDNSLEKCLES
jgi:hypothetical protein